MNMKERKLGHICRQGIKIVEVEVLELVRMTMVISRIVET